MAQVAALQRKAFATLSSAVGDYTEICVGFPDRKVLAAKSVVKFFNARKVARQFFTKTYSTTNNPKGILFTRNGHQTIRQEIPFKRTCSIAGRCDRVRYGINDPDGARNITLFLKLTEVPLLL